MHPMNGGPNTEEAITVACIMGCPTIVVHTGKCYKALIDLGAAISLIRYSTYQHIDNSFKTPIQCATAKLNTVNDSPMTALGMMALHLRRADFKFTHNFVICNRLPDTEIIFGIDIQKKFSFSYVWDKEKKLLHTKSWEIFNIYTKTVNRRPQLALPNHHLKYHQDTTLLYQLKSQDRQLRTI